MSPEARERSFDELASGLASGSLTRGKALRLMGAALLGGVLASGPGVALAAPTECTSPEVKCRGKCVAPSSFTTDRDCGACGARCSKNLFCASGVCRVIRASFTCFCTDGTSTSGCFDDCGPATDEFCFTFCGGAANADHSECLSPAVC
jgi:hypothetical protein